MKGIKKTQTIPDTYLLYISLLSLASETVETMKETYLKLKMIKMNDQVGFGYLQQTSTHVSWYP